MYGFSAFVVPLTQSLGWSRLEISGSAAFWAIVFGMSGPLAAWCLERLGARNTMLGGAAIAGFAAWMMSGVKTLAELYGTTFVSAVGVAACTLVPVQTVVSQHYPRTRGRALGLAMLGLGIGGLVTPPITAAIIHQFDWQVAMKAGAVSIWFIVIPFICWGIPQDASQPASQPAGQAEAKTSSQSGALADPRVRTSEEAPVSPSTAVDTDIGSAIRSVAFWQLFAIQVLFLFGAAGLNLHFLAWSHDQGIAPQPAANVFGLAMGASVLGRLLGGWLSDGFPARLLLSGFLSLMALSTAWAGYIGLEGTLILIAFATAYGLGLGGTSVLLTVVVGQCFGMKHFGRILACVLSGIAIGAVFGPVVAGLVRDHYGTYSPAIYLFALTFAVSAWLAILIKTRHQVPVRTDHCAIDTLPTSST